jgi:hypothetical protein
VPLFHGVLEAVGHLYDVIGLQAEKVEEFYFFGNEVKGHVHAPFEYSWDLKYNEIIAF